MTKNALDKDSFYQQFHNEHHFADSDDSLDDAPPLAHHKVGAPFNIRELCGKRSASVFAKGGAIVDRALAATKPK
jgi:hypothetical protein